MRASSSSVRLGLSGRRRQLPPCICALAASIPGVDRGTVRFHHAILVYGPDQACLVTSRGWVRLRACFRLPAGVNRLNILEAALVGREIGAVMSMIGVVVAVLMACLCAAVVVALRDADPDVREVAREIIKMILELLPRGRRQ